MAVLALQDEATIGVAEPTFTAATGADDYPNLGDGSEIWIRNDGGVDTVVTATCRRACSHGFLEDVTVTVPPGVVYKLRELPPGRFNDDGLARIGCSPFANVGLAAVRRSAYRGG